MRHQTVALERIDELAHFFDAASANRRTDRVMKVDQRDAFARRQVAQPIDDAPARVARRAPEWDAVLGRAPLRGGRAHAIERSGIDGRGRTIGAQRTKKAFRRARGADRRAEIHEGRVPVVRAARGNELAGAPSSSRAAAACGYSSPKNSAIDDSAHVRIDRRVVEVEGEGPNRRGGIRADARQRAQLRRARDGSTPPYRSTTAAASALQAHGARVVAESLPFAQHVGRRGAREASENPQSARRTTRTLGTTRSTCVCASMNSLTTVRYGSRATRHGNARATVTARTSATADVGFGHERNVEIA